MSKNKSRSHTETKGKKKRAGAYGNQHEYAVKGEGWAIKGEGSAVDKKYGDSALHDKMYLSNTKPEAIRHAEYSNRNVFFGGVGYAAPVSEKINVIKNGVSKQELEAVKEESDLDYETLSNILSVSKAKLHSKKGADKFDQNTSERIMLLADVVAYGQSVFEDKDSFNEWLKTNNTALGNKTPIELMDTIYGIDEVKKEIGRIEYGVF
jgi:putative toxin-antitoxin system antitoxin component (TIGR02293 family)